MSLRSSQNQTPSPLTVQESEQYQSTQAYQYPSLFQIEKEIPSLNIAYRWWEDDATPVLWAFEISAISQVTRYQLFSDEDLPRTSLMSRNPDTIDKFLSKLSDESDFEFFDSLSHLQRVEEILRRISLPKFQPVPWSWFPPAPDPLNSLNPGDIADQIETESHFHFSKIAFEEIVRASLGYKSRAVSVHWFLLQHNALFVHLYDHIKANPDEIDFYIEVEKYLRSKSPFAHRALVACLYRIRPEVTQSMPALTGLGFKFISGPIHGLVANLPKQDLTVLLKVLSVLKIRYRKQYAHASTRNMDWRTPFNTTNTLLEDFIHSSGLPANLAHNMTTTDEIHFVDGLSKQTISANDPGVKSLLTNWHTLSNSVWECCCASRDMTEFLRETTLILFHNRNYYSLTAILDGLHKYAATTAKSHESMNGSDPNMIVLETLQLSQVQYIMKPDDNFFAYRERYYNHPGLPFLIPHLRDPHSYATQSILDYLESL